MKVREGWVLREQLTFAERNGTHMDSPACILEGAEYANEFSGEQFFAPLAVVDISERAESDPDARIVPDDLLTWDSEHGALPAGAFVAMNSV